MEGVEMGYSFSIIILAISVTRGLDVTRLKSADLFSNKLNEDCGKYGAIWNNSRTCVCQLHTMTLSSLSSSSSSSSSSKQSFRCLGTDDVPELFFVENKQRLELKEKCHTVTQAYIWNTFKTDYGVWEERTKDISELLSIRKGKSVVDFKDPKKWSGQLLNITLACKKERQAFPKTIYVKFKGTIQYPFNMTGLFPKVRTTNTVSTTDSIRRQNATTSSETTTTFSMSSTTATTLTITSTKITTTTTKTAIIIKKIPPQTIFPIKTTTTKKQPTLTSTKRALITSTAPDLTPSSSLNQKTTTSFSQTLVSSSDGKNSGKENIFTISLAAGSGAVFLLVVIVLISCVARRRKKKDEMKNSTHHPEIKDNPSFPAPSSTAEDNDVYLVPVDLQVGDTLSKTAIFTTTTTNATACRDLNNPIYRDADRNNSRDDVVVHNDDMQTYATIEINQQSNNIYTGLTRNRSVQSTTSSTCSLMNEPSSYAPLLHQVNSKLTSVQENYETVHDLRDPQTESKVLLSTKNNGVRNDSALYNEPDLLSVTNLYAVLEPDPEDSIMNDTAAEPVYNILDDDDTLFYSDVNNLKQPTNHHTQDEIISRQPICTGADNPAYDVDDRKEFPLNTDVSDMDETYDTANNLDTRSNEYAGTENLYHILEPS